MVIELTAHETLSHMQCWTKCYGSVTLLVSRLKYFQKRVNGSQLYIPLVLGAQVKWGQHIMCVREWLYLCCGNEDLWEHMAWFGGKSLREHMAEGA